MAAALDPMLDANAVIAAEHPALWEALSALGRRVLQPVDLLPQQSAEARGKRFNATIGQITDGRGGAVPLPTMERALSGLPDAARSRAFLYSPVDGLPELRSRWRDWQRRDQPEARPSSLPLVTVGPAQALCLAAELFVEPGRTAVIHEPLTAGTAGTPADSELLADRLGARVSVVPLHDGRFDPAAIGRRLALLPDGEPAVVVLRFPTAAGFMPNGKERSALRHSLIDASLHRPLVVIVDDVWEVAESPAGSLFWGLIDRAPNLVAVKVDGADGCWGFPGGRVGFLTFPFDPGSGIARALESKVKMLLRAAVGSPVATSQAILLEALA